MQSLAAAMEAAHRTGLVLSIDDPSRLRIGVDGHAALAFPASMPETTVASDLRGIGGAMCALLNLGEQQATGNHPKIPFLMSDDLGPAAAERWDRQRSNASHIAAGSHWRRCRGWPGHAPAGASAVGSLRRVPQLRA